VLTFDRFCLFESKGPNFSELAPLLAARLYLRNVRVLRDRLDDEERREVECVLALARDAAPSAVDCPDGSPMAEACAPKKPCEKPVKGCLR
jgi:hypothetical protein